MGLRFVRVRERKSGTVVSVAELPPEGLDVAIEIGRIASAFGTVSDRAQAVVASLHKVIPFEAVWVCLLDTEQRGFTSLVRQGYDQPSEAYFDSPTVFAEAELLGLDRPGPPMRLSDMPIPPAETRGWTEYMWPAGFREGLGVGLFSPDGRHIGMLTVNTDTLAHPTESARDLVGALATTIASAVDPMRSIGLAARSVNDAWAGVVLTRAGHPIALPGLPTHPLLADGSDVLAAAAERRLDGRIYSSFLCPYARDGGTDGHVRATMLACPPEPPYQMIAVVLLSPVGDLRGLTRRELEIVGLLVDGWSNGQIAASLVIAERTVATHVEHILAKLDASTRALAAVRALRHGLYVPRPLNGVRD